MSNQNNETVEDQVTTTVLAEGVDEEPIESNRRMFTGQAYVLIAALSAIYAAFHMIALNGVSISEWTGIVIPFLPQFPMETWNFRIAHIAGALALGFLLFSAQTFRSDTGAPKETRLVSLLAILFLVPVVVAAATVIGFVQTINSGTLPEMGGLTTWAAFPGTEIFADRSQLVRHPAADRHTSAAS
jgi:hypothetical protein